MYYIYINYLIYEYTLQRKIYIQGEAHKVYTLSESTQTIDHIQKCFRKKFQCSRRGFILYVSIFLLFSYFV